MSARETCRYCGAAITQASDGAWEDDRGACGCGDSEHEPETVRCLQHGTDCAGRVEYRMPLSATGNSYPRCEAHWAQRLDEHERISRDYPDSPIAPSWFDASAAGERWDEDY